MGDGAGVVADRYQQPSDLNWDPFDAEIDADPYPVLKRLRDEAPAYRNEQYNFYALSRFADVEPAHRDTKTFLSGHGTVLEIMQPDPLSTGQLMFLDPPDHTRLRALVSRSFTPRRVSQLEDGIRAVTVELLDAVQGCDRFDFVQDFAALLPSRVISSLLGVPTDDQEMLRQQIDRIFFIEPGVGMINDVSFSAQLRINAYIREQLIERRAHPRDDMLTDLTQAEIVDDGGDRRRLTDAEAADFGNLLISAGTETVARMLGWAAVLLAQHPDQRAQLATQPLLIPNAIEEILRYEAPSPVTGRWTTRDLDYHGVRIPANSRVLLLAGSANRDERQFTDPDRFDIQRLNEQHLAFGLGAHFCIGSALARMEGRIALEEVLHRYPEWDVDAANAERAHTSTVRGWSHLPVRI
jgi:cytochrome P450